MREPPFREILVIKPSSLGDIIDALPAVGAIRRRYPSARISWLVKSEWAAVLQGHPFIDEVIAVPFSWRAVPRLIQAVRRRPFDLVVDLQGLLRSALLGAATGASLRIGFSAAREGASRFYTDRVAVPEGIVHAVDRYREVARALGCEVSRVDFGFPASEEAAAGIDRLLTGFGLSASAPFIVIHPTARWESKKWVPARFAELADWLIREKKNPIVFVGSKGEREEGNRIVQQMKQPAINAAGRTTLPELAELIRRAECFICNDSGPMHLAAAVGTPVVALFGPTDPRKIGPYGAGHQVIRKGISCDGCHRNRCVRENECMRAISVEEVIKKISESGLRITE
ncbi:MAG: lipopolysaccharide heptosyltransferase II [Candidatus Manganitrophaceae bacterium]|nr:MAG: lipopolysaccharide heptosyltransferase II [Candidatus Manganitrophaceae bacterium]